jgi:hypothetical protein
MNTFNLSVFTSTKSAFINGREKLLLGKEFVLDSDNNIIKHSNALLIEGNVENVEVHGLKHLYQIIDDLTPNQAISTGQNITSHNRIVTEQYANKYNPCDAIAKTKDNFSFLSTHSLMFLDYDGDDYTLDEFRAKLIQLLPELEQCEMLMLGSSSSGIYKVGDNPENSKNGGIHTYFIVDNGTKIPGIGERLKYAAWKNEHGYHKVTIDGKLLPRHILDDTVYSPERMIFESTPILGKGIYSLERQHKHWSGGILSTDNIKISDFQKLELNKKIADNRLLYIDEAEDNRKSTLKHYEKKFIEHGVNVDTAKVYAQQLLNDIVMLPDCFELKSNRHKIATVADILNNIDDYLDDDFVDPFETHTSNEYRGRLFDNENGSIILYSFRHGGTTYFLKNADNFSKEITWQEALDKHVADFNKEYALVLHGSKAVVMKTILLPNGQKERLYLTKESFLNLHSNFNIQFDERLNNRTNQPEPIIKTIGEAWFKHGDRLQYTNGIVFEPSTYLNGVEVPANTPENVLNLWEGFSVKPKQGGAWKLLENHLLNVVCSGDEACYQYLLDWVARGLQRPDLNGQVAVVLRGEKGCGKGTLGNFLVSLMGLHGLQINNPQHLIGNFNSHMQNCCFMFADEVFFAGDRQHENILKGLITEPTILIERKGFDVEKAVNRLKLIMASNNTWVVPASADERRYFVLEVSNVYRNQASYFTPLREELENDDNKAAFLYDMLHRDISSFNVSKYPDTAALKHQRAQSLNSFGQYWLDVLDRGYIYQSHEPCNQNIFRRWQDVATVDLIKAGYAQWCNGNRIGQFNIVSPNVMGRLLSQCYAKSYLSKRCIVGENSKGEILYSNKRVYVYRLNSHVDAINAFCEAEKLCPISLLKNTDEEQITSNDFSVYFEYDEDVCHDQKWEEKRGNRLLEMLETCAD